MSNSSDMKRQLIKFYSVGWELEWLRGNVPFNYQNRMQETINLIKHATSERFAVLDVGCGAGLYSLEILRRFRYCVLTGLDISRRQIDHINKKLVGLYKNRAAFIVADAEDFDLAMKYDYIICTELIEHSLEPKKILKNLSLHAKGETKIIISVPQFYDCGMSGWFYRQFDTNRNWIETQDFAKIDNRKECYAYYHKQYSLREIKILLEGSDLRINKITFCNFNFRSRRLNTLYSLIAFRRLDEFLNWLTSNRLASTITILCEKRN